MLPCRVELSNEGSKCVDISVMQDSSLESWIGVWVNRVSIPASGI